MRDLFRNPDRLIGTLMGALVGTLIGTLIEPLLNGHPYMVVDLTCFIPK